MEYLFSKKDRLKNKLKDRFILLFLDYDGTLVPIADSPDKAVMSKELKDLLDKLSVRPYCRVAIISGRSLSDIKGLVGLKDIIYAGNHGLEIEGPKIKFESRVSPKLTAVIRRIHKDAVSKFSRIKGVLIEDKGLTISVHYRLVGKKDIQDFLDIFCEITESFTLDNKIKVTKGKKVYEIRPPVNWDKGKTVLWLLARQQFLAGTKKILPVYFGDDLTDEDGFRVLKNKGLTIFVGKPNDSEAAYYVRDTKEVVRSMKQILDME